MAAFDPATLDRWRALAIVDRDGSTVGTISEFYLDREKGDYARALARYNGSVGRRNYSDLVLGRLAQRWQYK